MQHLMLFYMNNQRLKKQGKDNDKKQNKSKSNEKSKKVHL